MRGHVLQAAEAARQAEALEIPAACVLGLCKLVPLALIGWRLTSCMTVQATDSQGRTPAQLAAASGNGSLAAYLQQEAQRLGQAEEVDAIVKSVSPASSGKPELSGLIHT